jgi:hypothetical protein
MMKVAPPGLDSRLLCLEHAIFFSIPRGVDPDPDPVALCSTLYVGSRLWAATRVLQATE